MRKKILTKIIFLSLIIFILMKFIEYENTLLSLNRNTKLEKEYPIFNDDIALFTLSSSNLKQILYIKELKKIDNFWIGNAYSYQDAYKKNSSFQWLEDDSQRHNPEYNRKLREIEYNKSTGYFFIDSENEIYGLSEEEIKRLLDTSSLNLENPEKYMKRNGERARLTQFSQNLVEEIFNASSQVSKLIFVRNLIIIYLGINLILSIFFFIVKKKQ